MPTLTQLLVWTFAGISTVLLAYQLTVAVSNLYFYPRLQPSDPQVNPSGVSILIPARNEAANIRTAVTAILDSDYARFEVLVLDDHSNDGTSAIALCAADADPRFRLIRGKDLPTGWTGKNWACHQLALNASYGILVFTDADVQWEPQALCAVITHLHIEQADMLTIWPTQITRTIAERLVVPLMSFAVLAYLPIWLAHNSPYPSATAANGQCLVFNKAAYHNIGGHRIVRNEVLDDVALARRAKRFGYKVLMADGSGLVRCHMYDDWFEIVNGYTKNILAGHASRVSLLLLSSILHLTVFVMPPLWLLAMLIGVQSPLPMWVPFALTVAGMTVRALTAYMTGQRVVDALWMPVSVLLMTYIALRAIWLAFHTGSTSWKGREVPLGRRT